LRDVAAVAALERRAAETLLAGLRPYLWITCSAQSAPEPQGELVCRNAADLVDIPPRAGCFTRDIHSAIRAGRTPLNLPADWQPAHPVARPACVGPRPLVTVNGCFDILHLGHLRFLEQARERGAALWILLNDDASVRRYKGPSRPVFPLAFRRDALLSLAAVDGVTPFPEDDPLRLLAELQPDIHVKGGSYEAARARRERELVASWGGRLDILPLIEGRSTSAYIRGVQNLNDKPSAMTG
jgi:rfaE bifunctional protein nucleotidyltransferase chain/domain